MTWDKTLRVDCEGPCGIPCTDQQARALEEILKALPKDDGYAADKLKLLKPPAEVSKEGRFDVSWISTEDKDHQKDIVISKGMRDHVYKMNPIVTWNHDYKLPAVGLNQWLKPVKEGGTKGIKAKTHYPIRPDDWQGIWVPDQVLNLVDLRLLPGKSIGFLPLKHRKPTSKELSEDPQKYSDVRYIVEEWLLLEYSVETMPANGQCLREHCQKGALELTDWMWKSLAPEGVETQVSEGEQKPTTETPPQTSPPLQEKKPPEQAVKPAEPPDFPFVTQRSVEEALRRAIEGFKFDAVAEKHLGDQVDRYRGRV